MTYLYFHLIFLQRMESVLKITIKNLITFKLIFEVYYVIYVFLTIILFILYTISKYIVVFK